MSVHTHDPRPPTPRAGAATVDASMNGRPAPAVAAVATDPGTRSGVRAAAASPADGLGGSPGLSAAQVERAVRLIRDRLDAAQSPPVTRHICLGPPSKYPPLSPAERAEVDTWVDRYMDPRTPTGAQLDPAARAAEGDDAGAGA